MTSKETKSSKGILEDDPICYHKKSKELRYMGDSTWRESSTWEVLRQYQGTSLQQQIARSFGISLSLTTNALQNITLFFFWVARGVIQCLYELLGRYQLPLQAFHLQQMS